MMGGGERDRHRGIVHGGDAGSCGCRNDDNNGRSAQGTASVSRQARVRSRAARHAEKGRGGTEGEYTDRGVGLRWLCVEPW